MAYAPKVAKEAQPTTQAKVELLAARVIRQALESVDENDPDEGAALILYRLDVAGFKVVRKPKGKAGDRARSI